MTELTENNSKQSTISERLIPILRQILGRGFATHTFPSDVRLADLGVNSMSLVRFMLRVESEFNITIPQAEMNPETFASLLSVESLIGRMISN